MNQLENLSTFRNMLEVNKHRLDDEYEMQPQMLERISDRVAILEGRLEDAHDKLRRIEAEVFLGAKDKGDSDKAAEGRAKTHPDRVRAFEAEQVASTELKQWRGLYEAWKAKGFSLGGLKDLYVAQYFSVDAGHAAGRKDRTVRPDYKPVTEKARTAVDSFSRFGESGETMDPADTPGVPSVVRRRYRE